jgi:deoxyribonuclease V
VILKAAESLSIQPDAYIFDGMGRAHPRRIGIASHVGLWLNAPTIGCGKTLLVGKYQEPPDERGAYTPLIDKGETIGVALRTRTGTKPVYISVGHRADLDTSIELVMRCTTKYRLPETTRAAHHAAGAFDLSARSDDELPTQPTLF